MENFTPARAGGFGLLAQVPTLLEAVISELPRLDRCMLMSGCSTMAHLVTDHVAIVLPVRADIEPVSIAGEVVS